MQTSKQRVNIFGKTYTLTSDADPEYLLRVAKFVNAQMQEINKVARTLPESDIAVLAAVNIASDLLELREKTQAYEKKIRQKSEKLLKILDNSLES